MSRIFQITLLLLLCMTPFSRSLQAQSIAKPANDTLKVLFVGNSFIYFFNMPQVVGSMMNTSGSPMLARKSTVGGSNLEQHWKGERGTKTMELIEADDWDYVVFNNHSRSAIETPESFRTYGQKWAAKTKAIGAVPLFMITWAYESNPLMQQEITQAYQDLAKETGAKLIPAGPLFEKARTLRPDLDLFHDNKHQSAIGTYLIALSFYKYLKKASVWEATHTPRTTDLNGESLQLIFIQKQDADFLKQLVDGFEMGNKD